MDGTTIAIDRHRRRANKADHKQMGSASGSIAYRRPASEGDERPVAEIAMAELAGCVDANPDLIDEPDPALSFARLIGLDRLVSATRLRLEEALAISRQGIGGQRCS